MDAKIPAVTALYGSLNAIFNIYLANNVSNARRRTKTGLGEGDAPELFMAIRIHSNNAEFVPLAIVMLLLAELCGGASMWLHIAGGTLLVSRVLHMIGMPRPAPNFFRFTGVAATWTLIVLLSGWTLWLRRGL